MSFAYSSLTNSERMKMLKSIGVDNIDQLFSYIPKSLKLTKLLDLPEPLNEWELEANLRNLAQKNSSIYSHQNYLGAGFYQHYIPAIIEAISSRGEFKTAYTPYQPEMSQGWLQVIYEYQVLIGKITGLPLVNGSNYDGSTALSEGAWMMCRKTKKNKILVADSILEQNKNVFQTYMWGREVKIVTVPCDKESGRIDKKALFKLAQKDDFSGLVFQSPNAYGVLEQFNEISALCKELKIETLLSYNPLLSGVYEPPGHFGIDVVTGEGQVLGIPLCYGGPGLGIFSATKAYKDYMPGRIVGTKVNKNNKQRFTLIHESREQHIARENATSNICSNQSLNVLRACVYLSVIGEHGLRKIAKLNIIKSHYLFNQLCQLKGVKKVFCGAFFNEFIIQIDANVSEFIKALNTKNIFPGIEVKINNKSCLLIAVTEVKTQDNLDCFINEFKYALNLQKLRCMT